MPDLTNKSVEELYQAASQEFQRQVGGRVESEPEPPIRAEPAAPPGGAFTMSDLQRALEQLGPTLESWVEEELGRRDRLRLQRLIEQEQARRLHRQVRGPRR